MRVPSAARAALADAATAIRKATPADLIAAARLLAVRMAPLERRSTSGVGSPLVEDGEAGSVAARLPVSQVGAIGVLAHGPRDEIALGEVAALRGQEIELGVVLHALGQHAQVCLLYTS